jgi:hypothetical protein
MAFFDPKRGGVVSELIFDLSLGGLATVISGCFSDLQKGPKTPKKALKWAKSVDLSLIKIRGKFGVKNSDFSLPS